MIKELDTVVLTEDLSEHGLRAAILGPWSWSTLREVMRSNS